MHPIFGMVAGVIVAAITMAYFAGVSADASAIFVAIGFGAMLLGALFGNMVDNTELPDGDADGALAALDSLM